MIRRFAPAAILFVVLGAACSSSTPTTETPTTAPATTASPSGSSGGSSEVQITMEDFDFDPADVTAANTFFCKYHRSQGMEGTLTVTSG